ncbi:hypothetical protein EHP00_1424 [Ecytonucleospora hepatopenaei]|uniref:Uncharacterized protein n=1 Tax=Ecytonucleospora hepatopenaei TaxID=646526 RepID=A0A1W0E542_9MICR|nr:hypothetical protein EHP00_1424 [Ecytonucleospora hepatopenaei]
MFFCFFISEIFCIVGNGTPLVITENIDDVEAMRYIDYSSNIHFKVSDENLAKEADFIGNIGGKSAYANTCKTIQKEMSVHEKIAFLLKKEEFTCSLSNLKNKKVHSKNSGETCVVIKPSEYVKLIKNGKTINLGNFYKISENPYEMLFIYKNGDLTNFGTNNSVTVSFYYNKTLVCKKEFLETPGQYKLTIGMPDLITYQKSIGIRLVNKDEADFINKNGFINNNNVVQNTFKNTKENQFKKEESIKENFNNKKMLFGKIDLSDLIKELNKKKNTQNNFDFKEMIFEEEETPSNKIKPEEDKEVLDVQNDEKIKEHDIKTTENKEEEKNKKEESEEEIKVEEIYFDEGNNNEENIEQEEVL